MFSNKIRNIVFLVESNPFIRVYFIVVFLYLFIQKSSQQQQNNFQFEEGSKVEEATHGEDPSSEFFYTLSTKKTLLGKSP